MIKTSRSPCPECGGTRAFAHVYDDMRWSTDGGYSGTHSFRALICSKCGFTTFYANGVHDLTKELRELATK